MEFLLMIALGVLLFLGIRILLQRQGQRFQERLNEAVTPETAQIAAELLTEEQHRKVYRSIAAGDGRQALAEFRQATGGPIKDCIIAVQALAKYPQEPAEKSSDPEEFFSEETEDSLDGELIEDVIDGVRDDVDGEDEDSKPIAEADPETGEIISTNDSESARTGTGKDDEKLTEDDVDERARKLMEESGFNLDEELTIPDEWAQEDEPAGFHLEVQRGDEKITLSHEDLDPWVHDQLYALLRDDHVDEAAELLAEHSPLTTGEAKKFLTVFKDQN